MHTMSVTVIQPRLGRRLRVDAGAGSARSSPAGSCSASAMSNSRSYSRPRRPNSTSINTFRVTPERSARVSCVIPISRRRSRIFRPTIARQRSHCATRSGLFWLGRVGTLLSNRRAPANVCPTSSTLQGMVEALAAADPVDTATPLGLDVLDEMCIALLECLIAAEAVQFEAGLNLDELLTALCAIQQPARSAFRAASLLHQGAAMTESWSTTRSRPKAVFARHRAAVRQGASPSNPLEPTAVRFNQALNANNTVDDARSVAGTGPQCAGQAGTTTEECTTTAVYLGLGEFAAHCYAHLTAVEHRRFRQYQCDVALQQHAVTQTLNERAWRAADLVFAEWLQRRSRGTRWLDNDLHG